MKHIGPKELLDNFDRVVADLEGGEEFSVTYHGTVVATLGSPDSGSRPGVEGPVFLATMAALRAADPAAMDRFADDVDAARNLLGSGA